MLNLVVLAVKLIHVLLLRDSGHVKEDILNEQIPMNNIYEIQLFNLKFILLVQELENEKKFHYKHVKINY
ncbi:unnamed protein product [Rotaria sordida]|uniref:Secreted protein n=1 Tax=Rotaria sordida TaxID=392033 RepID=A0A814VNH6_9BILA|nr:unnamed protein product [Rotaria sordida]